MTEFTESDGPMSDIVKKYVEEGSFSSFREGQCALYDWLREENANKICTCGFPSRTTNSKFIRLKIYNLANSF